MNHLLLSLVSALIGTIITEYLVLLLLIRRDPLNLFVYTVHINAVTNPLMNYGFIVLDIQLIPLEAGVILAEIILICQLAGIGMRYAGICSLCANGVSVLTGLFWQISH
ncbi:hypothetical protein [uncultured Methanospirillum sp.]|uniref:hypothetical protein n=1 Tax=uncultured Methanospirillum sp. TaxID=262503 RepID=UPI0029C732CC|nr:hypothetical protein [uncultured Methanospirillum sp.]